MKAWELIKHLEGGGRVRVKYNIDYLGTSLNKNEELNYNFENLVLGVIVKRPQCFEIVKTKKKIKLYRHMYSYDGDDIPKTIIEDDGSWTNLNWDDFVEEILIEDIRDSAKLLKTEEKEIEIDDD